MEVREHMENKVIIEEDTQHGRFLTFALGRESFGLEISYVTEIVGIQPITEIPEAPVYLKGIINLRGKIIPVIDVRLKFHKDESPYSDRTCIIVVDFKQVSIGLIVDNVAEVVSIDDGNIVPPPSYQTNARNRYIKGIGKVGNDIKLLLDCEELFDDNNLTAIENIS
jgi:purine-binding chemotaxis protein CheW